MKPLWLLICIVAWFYTAVWTTGQYVYVPFDRVGVNNGTVYERTQLCVELRTQSRPVTPYCWAIPVQHHVMTLGASTSDACRGEPVRDRALVEWYGRLRLDSSGSVANELTPWLELRHSRGERCVVYVWAASSELVVKCRDQWLVSWEAPAPDAWLWTRVSVDHAQLCMNMQYDRDGRVFLAQCAPLHMNNTRLEQVQFIGSHATLDIVSWNGEPVLDTLWNTRRKHWTDSAACAEAMWNKRTLAKQPTRYIDDQWVIHTGASGRVEFRVRVRELVSLVLGTVAESVACGVARMDQGEKDTNDACVVRWSDQRGETILQSPFGSFV